MKRRTMKSIFCFSTEVELCKNLSQLLREKGEISSVINLIDLKKYLIENVFDLLIIDLEDYPEEILEILQNYKSQNKNSFIIIFYSFHFHKPTFENLIYKLGDSVFFKPISIEDVLTVVDKNLKREK